MAKRHKSHGRRSDKRRGNFSKQGRQKTRAARDKCKDPIGEVSSRTCTKLCNGQIGEVITGKQGKVPKKAVR